MARLDPSVLFVDDEPAVLDALRRQLRRLHGTWRLGFESAPVAALEQVRRSAPDVVVTDLTMPGMNGLDLIAAMRQSAPQTRFIMLTGTADLSTAMEAINRLGIFRFYAKPCDAPVLIEGIEAALAAGHGAAAPPAGAEAEIPRFTESLGAAVLNRLSLGILVVDGAGRLVFTNQRGSLLLAAKDGLQVGPDRRCRVEDSAEQAQLASLIRRAAAGEDEGLDEAAPLVAVTRNSGGRPFSVLVAPLAVRGWTGNPLAALFVTDPDEHALPSPDSLRRLYGLTRAEAGIAHALATGERLEAAAQAVGVTVSTARTYLKLIFAKTATHRQSDLVKLVLASNPAVSA